MMIQLDYFDTLGAAIEAQYYIRPVHGGFRRLDYVPEFENEICIAHHVVSCIHRDWNGCRPYGPSSQ